MVKHTQTICRLLPTSSLSVFDHLVGWHFVGWPFLHFLNEIIRLVEHPD